MPEAINILSSLSLTANYNSPLIPVIPNTYFLVATSGYNYLKTDNIRLRVDFASTDPIQYTLQRCSLLFKFKGMVLLLQIFTLKCKYLILLQQINFLNLIQLELVNIKILIHVLFLINHYLLKFKKSARLSLQQEYSEK